MCIRKCKDIGEELKDKKKLRTCKCEKKIELFNVKMAYFEMGFKLVFSS